MEEHTKLHHSRRSPERIIKNQMLSILYRLEEYLLAEEPTLDEVYSIEYFIDEFYKVFKLNKTQ